jgi:hypothetical protein
VLTRSMRKTIWAGFLALAAFTAASEARADWGLHSGDTLRSGDNMLYGEVGWPDLVFGFQHGMSDRVDLGFRFSLIYGYEYRPQTELGLGMRVPIRIAAIKREKVSLMIRFEPGIKFDQFGGGGCARHDCLYDGGLAFGLWLPFGIDFGIHITREATISFGLEAPFYVNFTNGVYGAVPLLFGPGFEYHVDEHIALGFNVKIGPSILANSDARGNSFSTTDVGLITTGFFAYRL